MFNPHKNIYLKYFALVLLVLIVSVYATRNHKNYKIRYDSGGFSPKNISLSKGDVVVFSNNSEHSFWPASDLHPSHLAYPEFDTKKALPPGESWEFKFEKPGKWPFHNHLDPDKVGVVNVRGFSGYPFLLSTLQKIKEVKIMFQGKDSFFKEKFNECSSDRVFDEERLCWESAIGDIDKIFGTEAAFDFLAYSAGANEQINGTCHYYSEYIGFLAYEKFFEGSKPETFVSADMCGYGFYHAFLQELVSHTKDLDKAYRYCESLDYSGSSSFRKENCIQGLGIGLVFKNASYYYGRDKDVVSVSLSECKKFFSKDEISENLCNAGVFSGLAHLYFGDHGIYLDMKTGDPFWVCKTVGTDLQNECYPSITEVTFYLFDKDAGKTASYISDIKDKTSKELASEKLGVALFSSGYFSGAKQNPLSVCNFDNMKTVSDFCFEGFIKRYISVNVRASKDGSKEMVCDIKNLSPYRRQTCERYLKIFIDNNEKGY